MNGYDVSNRFFKIRINSSIHTVTDYPLPITDNRNRADPLSKSY